MWGLEPAPAPAPAPSHHDGPPEELSPPAPCRLSFRPRDLYDCGCGPWQTRTFPTHDARVAFVDRWQHDFEMRL